MVDIVDPVTLDGVKSCATYGAGETIAHQGSPCIGIHCVLDGCVASRTSDANGCPRIFRLVWPGDLFGHCSYFAGSVYRASAVAVAPSRVCFIDRVRIESLRAEYPALGEKLLRLIAANLAEARERHTREATDSVPTRLAHVLNLIMRRVSEPDTQGGEIHMNLPLSRRDLAALVGVRPETIARAINSLAAGGVAHFKGRHVTITDVDALVAAAQGGIDGARR